MRLQLLLLAGQAVTPVADPPVATSFDLAKVRRAPPPSTAASRCGDRAGETDVIVCGGRTSYRLPLPTSHEPGGTARDQPGGMAALTPTGPCGMFAGENRCRNADKAVFGYGHGRDPVTVLSRLVKKAVDPDAD